MSIIHMSDDKYLMSQFKFSADFWNIVCACDKRWLGNKIVVCLRDGTENG